MYYMWINKSLVHQVVDQTKEMLEISLRWTSSLHGLWKLLAKLTREETG